MVVGLCGRGEWRWQRRMSTYVYTWIQSFVVSLLAFIVCLLVFSGLYSIFTVTMTYFEYNYSVYSIFTVIQNQFAVI